MCNRHARHQTDDIMSVLFMEGSFVHIFSCRMQYTVRKMAEQQIAWSSCSADRGAPIKGGLDERPAKALGLEGCRLRIPDYVLRVTGCGLRATGYCLLISDL